MTKIRFSDYIEETVHEFGYVEFEKLPKSQQIILCNAAVNTGSVDLCEVLVEKKIDFIKFLESSYKDSDLKDHYDDKNNHADFASKVLGGYIDSLKDHIKERLEEYIYFLQGSPGQDNLPAASTYGSLSFCEGR